MFFIKVEPQPGSNCYKLLEAVIIEGVHVPADFLFDGASIPRILWEEIGSPFQPRFMAPALVHDWIYRAEDHCGFSRKEADKLFKKLLLANGVDEDLAKSMYAGVRIGGADSWKN